MLERLLCPCAQFFSALRWLAALPGLPTAHVPDVYVWCSTRETLAGHNNSVPQYKSGSVTDLLAGKGELKVNDTDERVQGEK